MWYFTWIGVECMPREGLSLSLKEVRLIKYRERHSQCREEVVVDEWVKPRSFVKEFGVCYLCETKNQPCILARFKIMIWAQIVPTLSQRYPRVGRTNLSTLCEAQYQVFMKSPQIITCIST